MPATNEVPVPHACVVHLGFSGSRDLFPGIADPLRRSRFTAELTRQFGEKLAALAQRPELRLHEGHFFVGVASMAAGADGVFADACAATGIALRVLLPQPREAFLSARSSKPPHALDFTPAQREQALQRLQRAGVVQEQAVATAQDAARRLVQTGVEILQTADILLTLQAQQQDGADKPGASNALAAQALAEGKPVYALTFWIDEKQTLHLYDEWRAPAQGWQPPQLPAFLGAPALPQAGFVDGLRRAADSIVAECEQADAAASLRAVHVHLGLCAAAAVLLLCCLFAPPFPALLVWLAPLLLLALLGAQVRQWHADRVKRKVRAESLLVRRGFAARVAAQMARNTQSIAPIEDGAAVHAGGSIPSPLWKLSNIPLADEFRALRKTLDVAWLQAARTTAALPWQQQQERYLAETLQQPESGVLAGLERRLAAAQQQLQRWQRWSRVGGLLTAAILDPALLLLIALATPLPWATPLFSGVVLGLAVVLLPQISLHALLRELRRRAGQEADTVRRTLAFVQEQIRTLQRAESAAEFARQQQETEFGLLARTLESTR